MPAPTTMQKSSLILLLVVSLSSSLVGQTFSDFEWPKNDISPVFKEMLSAYNTNDIEELETYSEQYYGKDNPKDFAHYWLKVYSEYGELIPYSLHNAFSNKNALGVWLQGKDTKGWIMIVLRMNEDNTKIVGKSVMRGMRPEGNLPPENPIPIENIGTYLEDYLSNSSEKDHFSGAVLVAQGDHILFEGAYGMRNRQDGRLNNPNTSFYLASTSKTFVAVAITQLVEKGKLKYEDFIDQYIPEYPKDISSQVTIHHLLTHTSGIEIDDHAPFNQAVLEAKSIDDLLAAQVKYINIMNDDRRKDFQVLGKHDYSNENYSLLGLIVERVSRMSYAKYIEEHIFKPLIMQNAYSDYDKLSRNDNVAIGYYYNEAIGAKKNRLPNTDKLTKFAIPQGGLYASIRDMYTYFKAINSHEIVNQTSQEKLYEKHAKVFAIEGLARDYGYGFTITTDGNVSFIGHGGSKGGAGSRFEYYPSQDLYVIVLSNYGAIQANIVADHIKDLIEPNVSPLK